MSKYQRGLWPMGAGESEGDPDPGILGERARQAGPPREGVQVTPPRREKKLGPGLQQLQDRGLFSLRLRHRTNAINLVFFTKF